MMNPRIVIQKGYSGIVGFGVFVGVGVLDILGLAVGILTVELGVGTLSVGFTKGVEETAGVGLEINV